jgi:hypothetical protein
MVGPFLNFYFHDEIGIITALVYFIVYAVPLLAFAVPLCIGLGLVAGQIETPRAKLWRPWLRHIAGIVVLVVGWWIAAGIDYGIIRAANWIRGA